MCWLDSSAANGVRVAQPGRMIDPYEGPAPDADPASGSATTAIRAGLVRALLAAVLFGASAPLAKGLLRDVRPQMLAGLLYLGSGLGLLVCGSRGADARGQRRR